MKPSGYIPGPADLEYIEATSSPLPPVLAAMEAEGVAAGWPILDRESGRLLAVLAFGRPRILEVGTGYGYSTLWLAVGQGGTGRITTIDTDVERTALARARWRAAGVADGRVVTLNRPALEALADDAELSLAGPFDLVFLDGPKAEYPACLDAVVPRLAPGALVVADNALHGGAVARSGPGADAANAGIRAFNATIMCDPRFTAALVPIGDGLVVAAFRL